MRIKAVTIDFWNTLFDNSNGVQRNAFRQKSLIQAIDKHGLVVRQDEFSAAMTASWEYFNNIWKNESRTPMPIDTARFFWNYLKLPEDNKAIDSIVKDFGESILEYPPALMPGVKDALLKLSPDFKLAVVSDTGFSPGSVLRVLLEREGIFEFFSSFSFSDETGVSKPHSKAFTTVLNEIDVEPEYAIHIGDIEATDIKGAKQMGMFAIRFTGDPSASLANNEFTDTIADKRADTWEEIVQGIYDLNNV